VTRGGVLRPAGRILLGLALAAVLLAIPPTTIAHGGLLDSDPPNGASLAESPGAIRLTFSEAVAADLSAVRLVDGDGRPIPLGDPVADPRQPVTLIVTLPALPDDAYRLTWRVVSDSDLHATTGSLVFGVGVAAGEAAPQPSAVASPAEWLGRAVDLAGLLILIGSLGLLLVVVPDVLRRSSAQQTVGDDPVGRLLESRLVRLAILAAIVSLVAGSLRLLVGAAEMGGPPDGQAVLRILGGSTYGSLWLGRQLALIGCAVALWFLVRALRSRGRPGLRWSGLAALAAAAAIAAHAAAGHLPSTSAGWLGGSLLAAIHIGAAGVWVGGVMALAIAIVPLARHDAATRAHVRAVLRRFSLLAIASVAILAVTGMLAAGRLVASIDALILSPYGIELTAKVVLVAAVMVAGALSARAVHPRLAALAERAIPRVRMSGRMASSGRPVRREAILGLAVVALAALLAATPPANGPAFLESSRQLPVTSQVDDLIVTVAISPNVPGRNLVTVRVLDTRRPAPAPITSVVARVMAPPAPAVALITDTLTADADRTFVGAVDLPVAADVDRLTVTIERSGLPEATLATPWRLDPKPLTGARPGTVVSKAPIGGILDRLALALGLLAAAVAGAVWLWRRMERRRRSLAISTVGPAIAEPRRGETSS
jgi:copper transport protein